MEDRVLKEVRKGLAEARKKLKTAEEDLALARRAGIDVSVLEKRRSEIADNLRRMEAVYGRD